MARVDVPASRLAWPLLDAGLRRLSGAVQVLVIRVVPSTGDSRDAAPQDPAGQDPAGQDTAGQDTAGQDTAVQARGSQWLARPDLVSIAALTTPVDGAALALALACDFRVLAHDVTLCAGGAGFLGGVRALAGLVGRPRALELCLTGRRISAAEAAAVGLATVTAAHDQLDDTVADLIAALLSTPHPTATEIKALLSPATDTVVFARQLADEYAAGERLAHDGA